MRDIFQERLRAKSPAELEELIDNWMLSAGSISEKPTLDAVTSMIRQAEDILQEKRKEATA